MEKTKKVVTLVTLLHVRARSTSITWLHEAEGKPTSFWPPFEPASTKRPSGVHLQDTVMKVQEDESLSKQSEDTCAMTFPASVQRFFETDEEEKRCSGTERPLDTSSLAAKTLRNQPNSQPFNTNRGGLSHDHDSVPSYNSVNCCGVAGDFRSMNHAHEAPRQSSNAFLTEDAEEERCRALRGHHFMLPFGAGWPIVRRLPFHGPYSRPPGLFVIVEASDAARSASSDRLVAAVITGAIHAARLRDFWCATEGHGSDRPRYAEVQLDVPALTLSCVNVVVALA
ncbi:hypothetical protein MRX96_008066 [Rhipicephalus microplus]